MYKRQACVVVLRELVIVVGVGVAGGEAEGEEGEQEAAEDLGAELCAQSAVDWGGVEQRIEGICGLLRALREERLRRRAGER